VECAAEHVVPEPSAGLEDVFLIRAICTIFLWRQYHFLSQHGTAFQVQFT
jgi:hypothetical protein